MLYHFYEWNHAALAPLRAVADATKLFYTNPLNPFAHTQAGRTLAAMAELFERTTRVYGKPEFGLHETLVGGMRAPVAEKVVWEKTFCRLLHFERELPAGRPTGPRFLIVAPMSGHYATLLRGTVDALLPYADVYITDWVDARLVPVSAGRFGLEDYVDYVIEMLRHLGPDTHVIGVCQPAVPVLIATSVMEAEEDPASPASMTLMGGPIDTRINPTGVNKLAKEHGIDWFRENVVMAVPFPHAGFGRLVYPGFLQLSGFMSMNLDRHLIAHKDFFMHLVQNDGDSAAKHRQFYDEYNAVMDLTAEFYLETVEKVFMTHALPRGEMTHRGNPVDPSKIRRAALLTVEGENDDISGLGQTEAAQTLCSSLPDDKRVHYVQPKVGHYGVFNGSRFRAEIAPRIVDFALTHGAAGIAARAAREEEKAKDEPGRGEVVALEFPSEQAPEPVAEMDRPALDASTAIAALTAGNEVSPTLLERLKPKSKRKA
ncbi:polyhydroxyalkanoate depolymerase [Aureimonas psammosilenae]|uniref:polyhydroxyalkanoate depolymerase n=1 Tax=Aureimonas psammosilenae TaxID=2495496 RepID=UPI001260ECF6|nr:polyhydroxyalkanoate depolymerase [Aureimonas psammosilenae]